MTKSRNQALGDFNMAIGEFFGSLADLFADIAQKRFWRAGENYYQDAVDLSLEANAMGGQLDAIYFDDQPDTVGDPWSFKVGDVQEPILPLAHPILPDGKGGWVFITLVPRGTFDDTHGEDSR